MTAPRPRTRQPKQLDAGILQAEISSFGLHLAAGNKSAKTIRAATTPQKHPSQRRVTIPGRNARAGAPNA